MRQRNQQDDRVAVRDDEQPGTGDPASGNTTRRAADLLRAGDEAIEQVLSSDSVSFLAASRQMGGQ